MGKEERPGSGSQTWVREPAKGDSVWCLTLAAQLSQERAGLGAGCGVRVRECPQWVCSQEEASYQPQHSVALSKLCST